MDRQRTIKGEISAEGPGLQTGQMASLTLKSAPADSGITFIRTDIPGRPQLSLKNIDLSDSSSVERRTTLGFGPLQIQTTEHLMSALAGLGIDNLIVELDNVELPALDGSAGSFVEIIKKAGIVEQDESKNPVKIDKVIWVSGKDNMLAVFPDEHFKVSYTLSYPDPVIGTKFFSSVISQEIYEKEIAPARTFCLEKEAEQLLKMGLGRGANYENTLVMGKDGPLKTSLRFPDETVRHKVLDLIGDLYILGRPIIGHVIGIKSGHALNMELVKQLKKSC